MSDKDEWQTVEQHVGGDTRRLIVRWHDQQIGLLYQSREWLGETGASVALAFVPIIKVEQNG